jgi:hypothetical protein
MEKKAAEAEQVVTDERVEVIAKYAELADGLMKQSYAADYTADDVAELTERLIDHDLKVEEAQAKVAEAQEFGKIVADTVITEMKKQGSIK